MSNQIKPNDLRIGNYVFYDGRCFQIDILTKDHPFLNTIEFGVGVVTYEKLRPIRLTIDILLKCGFTSDLEKKHFQIKTGWYWDCRQDKKQTRMYINYTSAKKWFVKSPANGSIYLESLHQLQNLFFALSGEELEINL